jgi:hypothetical protein
MTEEYKINIALAELYGWTEIRIYDLMDESVYCGLDKEGMFRYLPKYWEDAYTFEELWPILTEEKKLRFTNELSNIITRENNPTKYIGEFAVLYFATARQRAEAMLRAFDKWKD